jgi:hypothetical protein
LETVKSTFSDARKNSLHEKTSLNVSALWVLAPTLARSPLIELESIRRDQWSNFKIDSVGKLLQQIQRVALASPADHRRWPKPGPDVDHGEDPYWPFLASDHRSDLINMKFPDGESFDFSMAEPTTAASCSFQPTMNCIPSNALGSSEGRFVPAFDAKSCDAVKDRATVLESMIRCAGCRAERLPASPASVSTTLPPSGLVETVADDLSTGGLPRQGALAIATAETLHRWGTL